MQLPLRTSIKFNFVYSHDFFIIDSSSKFNINPFDTFDNESYMHTKK
jgi:hypothetical protein